jgi:hypothetical protein
MSKHAQNKLILPSTSPENEVLIVEEFSQLNQTEESAITELDSIVNIHEASFTCKNSKGARILIRYYSHRTYQNISNNW